MNKVYVVVLYSTIIDEDIMKEVESLGVEVFKNKKDILKKYNLVENEDDVYKITSLETWEVNKWLMIWEREVL